MPEITLPPLPYKENALAPHISEETMGFHYHKHHAGYVNNLNRLLRENKLEASSLEDTILASDAGGVFNNAAQIWNHTFYWESMSPGGGGDPQGDIADAVQKSFGSADDFRVAFKQAAVSFFGSGWIWLVKEEGGSEELKITATANADLPLRAGAGGSTKQTALLTLDVWEHAYYLDYQNLRADYIDRWLENLVNWEFAESNFSASA